ncbi:Regucalcin, partial [Blattella germanica]
SVFFHSVGCCKHRTPLQVIPVTSPVQLGEGPHWDSESQTLFYVDINSNEIHRYCPRGGKETTLQFSGFGNGVSFVIPVEGTHSRQLLTSVGHDIMLVDWYHQNAHFCPSSQNVTIIASVEVDRKGNRWNDGKADANGRLWAGTMGPIVEVGHIIPNRGTLFVLNSDSDVPLAVVSPISVSNGLAWNENNTLMYYIDYLPAGVDVFDFNLESGTIANRRKIFDLREHGIEGFPDGMTIDNNGNLWVACYNGSQKYIYVDLLK